MDGEVHIQPIGETTSDDVAATPGTTPSAVLEPSVVMDTTGNPTAANGASLDGSNGGNEPSGAAATQTVETSPVEDASAVISPVNTPEASPPPPQMQSAQTPPPSAPAGFISAMPPDTTTITALLSKALQARQTRKQVKLDKIIAAISKNGKITNKDVCNLLRVSSATATRYLDALQHARRIRQTGQRGRTAYIPVLQYV